MRDNPMVNEGKVMEEAKAKALQPALAQIEKQFGKGSIMKMDSAAAQDVQVVSTGSLGLDIALGVGGLPRGRVVEIYGPESSGKTTLTLSVIAQAQKLGGTAAFIDAENALDPQYAAKLGVKIEELLISQPDTGEQALEIADMLVRSGSVDVIVIDSVAALTPKAEIEGEMGEPQMGLQARLMSQALRKLTSNIKRTNTLVIFINQIRMKIGVLFGNPETTTGGNALKFYASVRMDIRRIGSIKKGDEVIGSAPGSAAELRQRALRLLARREHSRAELARKLAPHAGSAQELGSLLDSLIEEKQLSDERYTSERARWLARKYGPARIRHDLRAKGVAEELIAGACSRDDELEQASLALKKKYRTTAATRKERARRARFLQGRGFSYEAIRRA